MKSNQPKNKEKKCEKCKGTSWYQYSGFNGDTPHCTICDECCTHSKGFWELKEHYGNMNGKMCCINGCGFFREKTENDLEQNQSKECKGCGKTEEIKQKWYEDTISLPRKPILVGLWVVVIALLVINIIIYGNITR